MTEAPKSPTETAKISDTPQDGELLVLEAEVPTGMTEAAQLSSEPAVAIAQAESSTIETNVDRGVAIEDTKTRPTKTQTMQAIIASAKKKHSKKRVALLVVTACLAVVGGGVATFLLLKANAHEPLAVAKQVQSVQTKSKLGVAATIAGGTVTYQSGENDWMQLSASTQLKEGDLVKTSNDSRVVLTFDDGSALRLDGDTTVVLASLVADDIKVTLNEGVVYSRVTPSDRSYTVTAGDMAYKALGTAFSTINKPTEKGVQVFQSSVKAGSVSMAVKEGEQYFNVSADSALKEKITSINLDSIAENSFMLWNLAEDEKSATFKEKMGVFPQVKLLQEQKAKALEEQKAKQASGEAIQQAAIVLTGATSPKGADLSWTVANSSASDGFKIVRSSSSDTPTFGKDDAIYVSDASARSYTWQADKSATYWFRVCVYQAQNSTCSNYSNAVKVAVTGPTAVENKSPVEKVTRGLMTLSVNQVGKATWTYTGKAVYGYKLVASKSQAPTFPENTVAFFDAGTNAGFLSLKDPGTYYVRICAWTNGTEGSACLDYSNQIVYVKN